MDEVTVAFAESPLASAASVPPRQEPVVAARYSAEDVERRLNGLLRRIEKRKETDERKIALVLF